MRIGFTGTHLGMTEAQRVTLRTLLTEHRTSILHHGDCIGADAEAHDIAEAMGCKIVIHPPVTAAKRAWKTSPHIYGPRPYLKRNRDIVRETQLLIAAPNQDQEVLRSGTWSTVRFARKSGRRVLIILPDGKCVEAQPAGLNQL